MQWNHQERDKEWLGRVGNNRDEKTAQSVKEGKKEKCGSGWRTVFPVEIKSVTKDKQHQPARVCAFPSLHWGEVKQEGWKNESKENKLPTAPLLCPPWHMEHPKAPQSGSSSVFPSSFSQVGCGTPLTEQELGQCWIQGQVWLWTPDPAQKRIFPKGMGRMCPALGRRMNSSKNWESLE